MRLTLLAALAAASCGASSLLPDGGRAQLGCSSAEVTVPVKVLGLASLPVRGATVTATRLADASVRTFLTDDRGVAVLPPGLGPGVVRVRATLDDLASPPADVTFTGGACVVAATPSQLTLTLERP